MANMDSTAPSSPRDTSCPVHLNKQMQLLHTARNTASFEPFELACLIYGGADVVGNRRAALERVETLIGTRDTSQIPRSYANMNREQAYDEGLEWGKAAFEDGIRFKHDFFAFVTPRFQLVNSSPFGMNTVMFEPAIRLSASAEQQAKWLPLSKSGKIIGAYVQTELGHGSFVRGIETTATWDSDTDEFVLHSPSTTSTKFWPGALGFSCTHGIVVARLIIRSKDYGPHLFMVQLRSLDDGRPLPGVELGDVGLKMSYNATCNGFATFHQVRIPRTDMLMGHASVSHDGTYEGSSHFTQLSYSTMVMVRAIIVKNVVFQLAQAVTIAARYSTVRTQGMGPNGLASAETCLIMYQSQRLRILTLTAKAYAILFASRTCDAEYDALRKQQANGDHTSLPYVHALSSGLKVWTTQTAADGAEDARKCCGGQGYLAISGLPEIVASVTAATTFEGENYVLCQQVGRYLFKCIDQLMQGKPIDYRMAYLAAGYQKWFAASFAASSGANITPCMAFGKEFLDPNTQLSIYRHRALRTVFKAYTAVRSSTKPPLDAWNENMMSIISAARAHTEYMALSFYIKHVQSLPTATSPALTTVMARLCSLFALSNIINPQTLDAISFVEDTHLSSAQLDTIRGLVNELLDQLAPELIALTDAWDFTDASLCSALGMYDGNVYENVMNWIRQIPMNKRAWEENKGVYQPGWKDWIEPVLKAKL
ncbi:acyl-CoA dehydrogenase/oxidase C-terminal [Clohesyomyces aquaticus]|uniref:Acyl-coenzyme A oxidase n=1 Tax=Clohesyomyces aquaticus TaxID=1231657 RepID=A0A1Y1YF70_9PLEO|nr:acyl-CoA dehydrogenase/oxidase C-terminal [Clohesyomyces aquaticus]